jgi:hypothetical protein
MGDSIEILIVVSGRISQGEAVECMKLGAVDLLEKDGLERLAEAELRREREIC